MTRRPRPERRAPKTATNGGGLDPVLAALLNIEAAIAAGQLVPRLQELRTVFASETDPDPLLRGVVRSELTKRLRAAGISSATQLAQAVLDGTGPIAAPGPGVDAPIPQSQRLADLAADAELFHSPDGDSAFATIVVHDHRETWAVRSRGFKDWLVAGFYQSQKRPPGAQPLADALALIEARARLEGAAGEVFLRVAPHADGIFVDLGTADRAAVRITRAGWEVVSDPPVKFVRSRGMLALPTPVRGGSIADLWRFANVRDEDRPLFAGALLMAFNPRGPYPVLVLHGGHGAAKSTSARVFQRLVDPNLGDLRAEPRDVRDLVIAASNAWFAGFDNLSSIPPWFSDCLCRLSTGAGFSTRELYTDRGEVIIVAQRPAVVNGIEEIVTRADLLSRSIILYLPEIDDRGRIEEAKFWPDFETARPALLGAIFTAVAEALRGLDAVQLAGAPRMADFARFATAGETALGFEAGEFISVYAANIAAGHQLALEASPIAPHIQAVALGGWSGTAEELRTTLDARVDETTRKSQGWPKTSKAVSNALRRIVANLRATGTAVMFKDHPELKERRRQIILRPGPEKAGNDRSDRSEPF